MKRNIPKEKKKKDKKTGETKQITPPLPVT